MSTRKVVEKFFEELNEKIEIDMNVLNMHTTKKNFNQFLDWLEENHDEWVRDESAAFPLVSAVETFLQACGREGYEFS